MSAYKLLLQFKTEPKPWFVKWRGQFHWQQRPRKLA